MREKLKPRLIELFAQDNWEKKIETLVYDPSSKTELLWATKDLLAEGYLEQAVRVAELFLGDSDPDINSEENQKILKDEEVMPIYTVRGTLCWLIQGIITQGKPEYFTRIITLLDKLASDKNAYVRLQCTYPLEGLTINLRAVKNKDGSPFNFRDDDRDKVTKIVFRMLEENKEIPRVLERLVATFAPMRFLDATTAEYVLKTFLYNKDNELRPDYVLHNVAPLVIYYAVFRKGILDDNFQDSKMKELLRTVIQNATPVLKSTLVWHFWKTIEASSENYPVLQDYIPLFFEGDFDYEPLGQYDFLVEKVMSFDPLEAIKIFQLELQYLSRYLSSRNVSSQQGRPIWFYHVEQVVEQIALHKPEIFTEVLSILTSIYKLGGYIGDLPKIYSAYKKAPLEKQEALKTYATKLYDSLRINGQHLPPLEA